MFNFCHSRLNNISLHFDVVHVSILVFLYRVTSVAQLGQVKWVQSGIDLEYKHKTNVKFFVGGTSVEIDRLNGPKGDQKIYENT